MTETRIRFLQDCEVEIVDAYDEEEDTQDVHNEVFRAGEEVEVDVMNEHEDSTNFQFGNGSMLYCLPNNLFFRFELEGNLRKYEDYPMPGEPGLIVRGTNECAIVVSKGILSDFELHARFGNDAFLNAYQWALKYAQHLETNRTYEAIQPCLIDDCDGQHCNVCGQHFADFYGATGMCESCRELPDDELEQLKKLVQAKWDEHYPPEPAQPT